MEGLEAPSRIWVPELVQRFAASLSPTEVAGTLRLVNKATATQFRGPQHTIMHLSQPVLHHAFVWRWAGTGAMRCLSVSDRRALARLTARSGSIANLEVLLARDDLALDAAGMCDSLFESAAEAGQLDVCAWLQWQDWPLGTHLLDAAARGGQQAVYAWLLANDCPNGNEVEAAAQAAAGGHVRMVDWLLLGASAPEETPLHELADLLQAVAAGCDLHTLQCLHHAYLDSLNRELPDASQRAVVAAAAGSPTADWQAKVLWLEARGFPRVEEACAKAAAEPDALARLQWLRQQGYPFGQQVAERAAGAGSVEALQYVLEQSGADYDGEGLMERAAQGGHVAIMEVLHARGISAGEQAAVSAAGGGHRPAVAWLVEKLGAGTALTADVFQAATGCLPMMAWLSEMGCPWDENVFVLAAGRGSEEQLEWLAERGCPMGDDGQPYVWAAIDGNLAILPCLRRLGCPWSLDGSTFTSLLQHLDDVPEDVMELALSWLLDQGCPVDWDQAEAAAGGEGNEQLQADDPSRMWLPELVQRFAVSLSPNEVAGTLRLVNKATATQFRGTQHSTMRLSQPVPHHAFVWRWAGPGAMRRLSVCDRRALARLTARSGSTANLEVLLARDDLGLDAPPMLDSLFESAAEAGQLDMCAWLQQQGWPLGTCLLDAAARGGQQAVYEWLLANGCPNGNEVEAAAQAAKRGHVRMMDWLLLGASAPEEMPLCKEDLLQAVAAGCDLPTLQRLHHTYLDSRGGELPDWSQQEVVAAAAGSPTADWQAKVLWLEARGCPRAEEACTRAAAEPDALARLQWLRQRGYPFGQLVAHRAAGAGSVEALQYVLDQGGAGYDGVGLMESAAHGGHVAIMEVLHARGIPADEHATVLAAAGGHLPAVAWLVEKLGAGTALTAGLFVYATGNMALMMWLREMGCPWGEQVFALAAKDGSEEQLEWLAEQGCPMGQLQADDPSRMWLPELVQRFAVSLSPNEVAGTLRLVNKATATQFRGPQHSTMHLSQPVPHHAFVWRWACPGAMRRLTVRDRMALPRLTARSGSIANLEVLLARDDLGLDADGMCDSLFKSAAEAGQLDVCAWLQQQGWPLGTCLLDAAARGGQQAVYEWLLANGCPNGKEGKAAAQAAAGGHVRMVDWLLLGVNAPEETPLRELTDLLQASAAGCDLPTLQRLHHTFLDSRGGELPNWSQRAVVAAAAGSPTADWQAKVEWLEARGFPRVEEACTKAAAEPGALARLQWLRQRGYPQGLLVAYFATGAGNVEALQYVLEQGGAGYDGVGLMESAALGGHVAIMEVLEARGVSADEQAAISAAGCYHLPAVAWLVKKLGAGTALTATVFQAATGNMALMAWLREMGCPWDENVFARAAKDGSEEQLEWLAEQGCPMGDDGHPYLLATFYRNLAILPCLRRLGCPWSPDGSTFTSLIKQGGIVKDVMRALSWMLDQGCPQLQADDPSRMWLPELVQRFAVSLSPNEVAGTLRLVNKATATQFRGPQHSTMHLSQPVPHHAFVWRWACPGAMRRLTVRDRMALPRLTARSGSIANLEVLLARDDLGLDADGMCDSLFKSAAEAGQLDVCAWLQQQGWPLGTCLLDAAARGGQQAVYEWLLANGCPNGKEGKAAAQAAAGGHVRMVDWLLLGVNAPEETPLRELTDLLQASAAGCDLPTLQRLHHTFLDSRGGELPNWSQRAVVAAAAGSPTADWQAKVEWLEARGFPRVEEACTKAAAEPGALARLQWLRQRGYPQGLLVAYFATGAGNVEALQYVLEQGGAGYDGVGLMESAALGGHVAIMEVLEARGVSADEQAAISAAGCYHLPAVAWLVKKLGAGTALTATVFQAATGNMALMAWLREMGCPWDENVFARAAKDGSEEQLEWLAEQGCPMGDDGQPYVWATSGGNLAILPCLRRLGCPWSPDGSTFTSLFKRGGNVKRALSWMLDQGCPVDWDQAEAAATERKEEGLL
ncbi:hypothetical protein TSOC_009814, partial [Tetrabaena socialis]